MAYSRNAARTARVDALVKKIGFLSFGHWTFVTRLADAVGVGCVAAVDRPGGGRRGAGRRRRILPGTPLRAAAGIPVPAAGGDRRAHQPDRDRHGRHRHALREPAVHGGGRRRGPPHIRRPPPAGDQPRFAGAGDRRLAVLRLPAAGGPDGRRHGPRARPGAARGAARRGLRTAQSPPDVPEPARPAAPRAALTRATGAHLVGRRITADRHVGGRAGPEPAELDPNQQRVRQTLSPAAG